LRLHAHGLSLLAVCLACSGCGGDGGPGQPDPIPGETIRIVDPAGALQPYAADIRAVTGSTLESADDLISVDGVTITIDADASRAIGGYGIGGFAPDGSTVEISIDAAFPGLEGILADRLSFTVAHELHHVARWRGPGYGSTLLEAMVSEGLADHFGVELLGASPQPWSSAFPEGRTEELLDRARPLFDSGYDHPAWFFGTDPTLPRWTGYTLGFRLVERHKRANPGATAVSLVNTPAGAFRP